MKIRLKGNSLRIRLSKPEVTALANNRELEDYTSFGANSLAYRVRTTPQGDALSAFFDHNTITLLVPASLLNGWADNEIVGFDAHMPLPGNEQLYLLLEKDFKCIDRTSEDESFNYDHPSKSCAV
jgi:hypothetical protein